jgi:hypothetical protein|tara:strand:+ start:856 stop:1596 length:741 start_codon:yes stop_codon:yes gene_type:complete
MATITFHSNNFAGNALNLIDHNAGSGIGFFGDSIGLSVPITTYQNSTYVTNSNGTSTDGQKLSNTKYASTSGAFHNGSAVETDLRAMPNYWAPLNVRFTHTDAVATQNVQMRIFNRSDIDVHATDVVTKVYEVRHPNPDDGDSDNVSATTYALDHRGVNFGAGAHSWHEFDPADSMTALVCTSSPGVSGLNTNSSDATRVSTNNYTSTSGTALRSMQHDWYLALSASPIKIGSKTDFGLYFTLEYL